MVHYSLTYFFTEPKGGERLFLLKTLIDLSLKHFLPLVAGTTHSFPNAALLTPLGSQLMISPFLLASVFALLYIFNEF